MRKFTVVPAIVALTLLSSLSYASSNQDKTFDQFLNAIRMKESSGVKNPKDGDNGKAIGPYQIWKIYWTDAYNFDKRNGGKFGVSSGVYSDCHNEDYARKVVIAYMNCYGKQSIANKDWEDLAKLHNAGPSRGASATAKANAEKYWQDVKKILASQN